MAPYNRHVDMLRGDALLFHLGNSRRWNQGQWEINPAPPKAGTYYASLPTYNRTKRSNPVVKERTRSKREAREQRPWILLSK
jgi:hypothetical protein